LREKPYFFMEYELQWFAKEGNGGEKTEPATSKKLQDARNEGQVAKSQELNSAFSLIALFIMLKIFISYIGDNLFQIFALIYNKIPISAFFMPLSPFVLSVTNYLFSLRL